MFAVNGYTRWNVRRWNVLRELTGLEARALEYRSKLFGKGESLSILPNPADLYIKPRCQIELRADASYRLRIKMASAPKLGHRQSNVLNAPE